MKIATWTKTGEHTGFPYTSMPAYSALPLIPCLFYLRVSTFLFACFSMLIVWHMSKKGYTPKWLINRLKGKMIGNRISARPIWHIRRFSFLEDPAGK